MRQTMALLAAVALVGLAPIAGGQGCGQSGQPACAANLVVAALSADPAAPEVGEEVTFSVTVRNPGTAESPPTRVRLILNGTELGREPVAGLAPGGSDTVSFGWRAAGGSWTVVAVVDAVAGESANDDNARTLLLDVLPATAADLIVRELAFAGVLVEGDEVEFRAIVENVGDRAAGEFVVQFRIGATVLGSVAVPGLPAGAATAPVAAPNWTARAGTWTLTAFADATDTVVERSETNNTRALGVAVGSLATLPDLVPESVDWGGLPLNEGDLTTIRVTIANLGGSPAGPTTTRFTLGTVAPVSTPALAAGDRTVLNLSWRASADAATLAIETDAEGDVRESNESNNVLEAAVDVLAAGQRPDLRLANLSAPEGNLFAGDTAVFSVIVRNDGNAPSPATTVRFSPADGEATPASSAAVPSLPPGGSVAVRSEAIPLRVGLAVVATADPDDRVRESNEDDNDATLALDVRVPPADLAVTAIEWEPRLPRAGETLLVHVRVENLGRGPARDVAVQFLVNDATIETRNLPAVASGAGATAEFTWAAVAGNHVLAAKANPARTVEETRHDNNERTQAVLVTSGGPPAPTPGAEAGAALATLGLLALALRRRLG